MSTSIDSPLIRDKHLPGDLALWWFVLAELSVFALLIGSFAVARFLDPAAFAQAGSQLLLVDGVALTLCLLGAGFAAACALEQWRVGRRYFTVGWLLLAQGLGSGYIVLKLNEYQHLLTLGLDIDSGGFFTQFWLISGFHFMHVLLGLLVLLAVTLHVLRGKPLAVSTLESATIYWHMLDLIWVMLFVVFYLLV
ncbi:cytochrome c oxidase subunit 3 [Atopomonas sediminilitoris]|uniref:cytochrome c oxidase subunit 3 n=1 Tax=Atopomonas sediminilitoris TaxID=2919919 RepID=UPI001F4ECCE9|nr:cytochrome c oxidase subunit 3 [Atopomonas sediminilitoris]MCJ8170836.1 cytochrome c oxidase subunit 3 [Atopomonas sediminilitoris]